MGHGQHALPSDDTYTYAYSSCHSIFLTLRLTGIQTGQRYVTDQAFSACRDCGAQGMPICFVLPMSIMSLYDEKQFFSSASAKTLKKTKYLTKSPDQCFIHAIILLSLGQWTCC